MYGTKRVTPFKTIKKGRKYVKRGYQKHAIAKGIPRRKLGELKQVDVAINDSLSTTATLDLLNGVAVGANEYNRVGRRIEMAYLKLNLFILANGSTPSPEDFVRVLVVYDRQANQGTPTFSQILQDQTSAGATSTTADSSPNQDYKFRFDILMDKRVYLGANNGSGVSTSMPNSPNEMLITKFIKLRGNITHWVGDTAAAGDIATGSLWLCTITDQVALANSAFVLKGKSRLAYHDA